MRNRRLINISGFRAGRFVSERAKNLLLGFIVFNAIMIGAVIFLVGRADQMVEMNGNVGDSIVWNQKLIGKTVVIDAGHGGIDPGAIGVTGVKEKDINLSVALKVKEFLQLSGVTVVMIREDDRDFGTSTRASRNKSEDLAYRTKVVADAQADVILSIHGNSFTDSRQQGAQVFHYKGSQEGAEFAQLLQDRLNEVTAHPRIIRSDNFYMLRNTHGTALTVEIGFLSCPEEEKKLVDPDYQSRLALAIALGVTSYLEN
ncbi:MAG: N-acetylmuramoyl-L-alanine amidase [Peptococcaceae bacterium]|nr:N-acetylmuramoyl-L-alanine amidase [Peptococcaceae bacterium]